MKPDNSTFKPALMLMTGRATAFVFTFFVPILLVRIFPPAEFGTYKQAQLILYTLYVIGQIGLAESLYYFLPTRRSSIGSYVVNAILMLGLAGVVCATLMVANSQRISDWLSNPALARYVPMIGALLALMLLGAAFETIMINRKQYQAATVTYVASDLFRAAFLVVPALLTRSLEWLLLGGIIFCAMRVTALVAYLRRELPGQLKFDPVVLREQLTYALPFALAVVVDIVQSNYHQYAVSWYFGAATFAIYSVGCLQIPLVDFMATPAANVMMVRMGEELRERRIENIMPLWHDTTRKLALAFFPMVAILVVSAHTLITFLFTKAYEASAPIFVVWSLSMLAAAFPADCMLRVFAETRFLFIINVSRLAAIALLMSWFLSSFQLIGAVLVTIIGILVAKSMALLRMGRLTNTGVKGLLPWKDLGGILLAAMAAAIPSAILTAALQLPPMFLLPISGAAYIIGYSFLIFCCGVLSQSERRTIIGWLVRPMRIITTRE